MLVDILGTNCDQCLSMDQCCLMSTETKAQDSHLDFHTAPELCQICQTELPIYSTPLVKGSNLAETEKDHSSLEESHFLQQPK